MVADKGIRISQVARKLNIHPNMLSRWKQEYMTNKNKSFTAIGHEKLREELKLLRKEISDLREEKEILKKALIILSKGKSIR